MEREDKTIHRDGQFNFDLKFLGKELVAIVITSNEFFEIRRSCITICNFGSDGFDILWSPNTYRSDYLEKQRSFPRKNRIRSFREMLRFLEEGMGCTTSCANKFIDELTLFWERKRFPIRKGVLFKKGINPTPLRTLESLFTHEQDDRNPSRVPINSIGFEYPIQTEEVEECYVLEYPSRDDWDISIELRLSESACSWSALTFTHHETQIIEGLSRHKIQCYYIGDQIREFEERFNAMGEEGLEGFDESFFDDNIK